VAVAVAVEVGVGVGVGVGVLQCLGSIDRALVFAVVVKVSHPTALTSRAMRRDSKYIQTFICICICIFM